MRNARIIFAVAAALLVGAGCATGPARVEPQVPATQRVASGEWERVAEGAERMAVDISATTTMILYRFSPERYRFGFSEGQAQRVSGWADASSGARLVVNGAYFHEDGSPSGFLAVDGQRKGTRAFDLDKSGVLDASNGFRIVDTSRAPADLDRIRNGAQSYPLFFSGGERMISRDSGQRARRTFVGSDRDGRAYVGVIARGEISLYRLMIALDEQTDVAWTEALNLDGGPSSGLAARFEDWTETADSFVTVPSAFVVTETQKN